ncbi:uncharacterized protein LOC116140889 [Pistacia vera]|uniref:uncharacterized protein LOC116140889 n=1 Tax=Pistacia vera TaxID=55513 RepID=UPI0012636D62|nr:uncharacterized protein LOC116140889 [Pistacia vera]
MTEEEWVNVAMSDDSLVVEMLLRLHQAEPPPTARKSAPPLQLEWSVRQRRSKQLPRKKADATRASPTTPLSWSGATSVSGGAADAFEESSKPSKPIDNTRSKVVATGETSTPKRSRKKKTLAELREEESLLLKEERSLKNQLATLRLTLEKQRTRNESLKRMKLDILSHQATEIVRASHASEEAILNQCDQVKLAHEPSQMLLPANGACNELNPSHPNGSFAALEDESKVSSFVLPDLNLPFDDDSSSGILYGIS